MNIFIYIFVLCATFWIWYFFKYPDKSKLPPPLILPIVFWVTVISFIIGVALL